MYELKAVSIRLAEDYSLYSDKPITTPKSAVEVARKELEQMDRECVYVINMNTDGTPININRASSGSVNCTVAEPREILKSGILSNAASILIIHNHISITPKPSKNDMAFTERMQEACKIIGITLLDHIIIGRNDSFFSFKENGLIGR